MPEALGRTCQRCGADRWTSEGASRRCLPCKLATTRRRMAKDPRRILLAGAQTRARRDGLPFDLQLEDIVIPLTCPALGIVLVTGQRTRQDNSPSLDRIVPEHGYVKGNVLVISIKANRIKSNATLRELRGVLQYLSRNVSLQGSP